MNREFSEKLVYISLGSNIGDRFQNIQHAIELINKLVGRVVQASSVFETEPWGFTADCYFFNAVIEIQTSLTANRLLQVCQGIEKQLGRLPAELNGYQSRPIDVDILFYGNSVIKLDDLVVPHPNLTCRRFVLVPLNEIASDFMHPVLYKSVGQLLTECSDKTTIFETKHQLSVEKSSSKSS